MINSPKKRERRQMCRKMFSNILRSVYNITEISGVLLQLLKIRPLQKGFSNCCKVGCVCLVNWECHSLMKVKVMILNLLAFGVEIDIDKVLSNTKCQKVCNVRTVCNISLVIETTLEGKQSAFREALPQIIAVCVKNVLLLCFGMTLGFPTILIPSLSGNDPNEKILLDHEAISWIGSINLVCVPVGCLLSGAITQPIGRKRAMQFVNIPFLTAWLLFHFFWTDMATLSITGLSGGLLEAPIDLSHRDLENYNRLSRLENYNRLREKSHRRLQPEIKSVG
ncbi:hypothetical protein NQ315_013936 [Exocentrus adspersus]|uniref:Uncharacterized protein n=1 Tax=Exocentrus adspersus TaxID=1586481 RepID=A0AAV8VRT4_9CUCU|nr:hypothetical protein NQ315_013936 [Exocentrus adspersus]